MKKLLLATYIFLCTGGTYAQERQNTVVAEVDFNRQTLQFTQYRSDTVRVTMLRSVCDRKCMPFTDKGYVVYRTKDTIYLDDRKIEFKAPVKVWMVIKEQ